MEALGQAVSVSYLEEIETKKLGSVRAYITGHNRNTGHQRSDVPPWLPMLDTHCYTWLQGELNVVCTTPWGEDKWTLLNSGLFAFTDFNLYHLAVMGFPCGSAGKESTCNAGDLGSIPRLGRSPGEGKGYTL